MKLRTLLERDVTVPASVTFEYERPLPDGEVEYVDVTIEGTCTVLTDPYGTGDSPTDTSFDADRAFVTDTGEQLDLNVLIKDLGPEYFGRLSAQACNSAF